MSWSRLNVVTSLYVVGLLRRCWLIAFALESPISSILLVFGYGWSIGGLRSSRSSISWSIIVSFSSIMFVRLDTSSLCLDISCWSSFTFVGCGWLVWVFCSLFISSSLFVSRSSVLSCWSDTDLSFSYVSLSLVLRSFNWRL